MVIGIIGATPPQPEDRGRFAQQVATTIPGVRDARITMSEPIRIDGQPGYETRIDATSGKDNTPVTVVQWLRFGGPNIAAHHRQRAARPMVKRVSALPRRARRHSAAAADDALSVQAALLGSLPLAAAGAALAPPLETPTSAGRSTRSPIV